MQERRYEECALCDARFDGEAAISSYLRDDERGRRVCLACLEKSAPKKAEPKKATRRVLEEV